MKKRIMLSILASTSISSAFSMGVGYDQTLAGVGGLSLRFSGDEYLFSIVVDQESNPNSATFAMGSRVFKKFAKAGALNPYFGIGFDFSNYAGGYDISGNAPAGSGANGWSMKDAPMALEFPLMIDYKFHPSMSISTQVGYKIGIQNDDNLGIKGDFFGGAGFTVWFDFDVQGKLSKDPQR